MANAPPGISASARAQVCCCVWARASCGAGDEKIKRKSPAMEDEILQRILAESFEQQSAAPNGPPKASQTALRDDVVDIEIDAYHLSRHSSCSICADEFELGDDAKKLPCRHFFHDGCILPWLGMHNSCPLCRFELPTLDVDYEMKKSKDSEDERRRNRRDDVSRMFI